MTQTTLGTSIDPLRLPAGSGRSGAIARLWRSVTGRCEAVLRKLGDPYRPELYYMRGPGPKWREKHGSPPA